MPFDLPFPFLILALDWLIRLALTARIIMRRAPVPVSLAWIALVFSLPVVGLILYLLVGETRLGRHRAKRHDELSAELERLASGVWHEQRSAEQPGPAAGRFAEIARLAGATTGIPALNGNRLELLTDSDQTLDRLAADIDGASHHCHLLYYIWAPSGAALRVNDALERAALRGVRCRVLVDAAGSKHFLRSPEARRLHRAGVTVVPALPVNALRMLLARVDLRNHRKLAVIDGRVGYMGSQNLAGSDFRYGSGSGVGPWIDATLRINGPAVQALQMVFLRDWQLDSDERIASLEDLLPRLPAETSANIVQIVPSGPGASPGAIQQALLTGLYMAREEIIITTPYFVPDEPTASALRSAAERGVSVILVVPADGDNRLARLACRAHYDELLQSGVRIFEHGPGLLHAKTMTFDRIIGAVSSVNIDMRSFYLNFECTALLYDDDFASVLRLTQMNYVQQSAEVEPRRWRSRPRRERFLQNAARLLGPLL